MIFILIYISHKKTTPKPGYVLYYKRYLSFIREHMYKTEYIQT